MFMNHWADDRKSVGLELPSGTCVLVEPCGDNVTLWLKPVTDQYSAQLELADALEAAAAKIRRRMCEHCGRGVSDVVDR